MTIPEVLKLIGETFDNPLFRNKLDVAYSIEIYQYKSDGDLDIQIKYRDTASYYYAFSGNFSEDVTKDFKENFLSWFNENFGD